jgi:hypothetical protein
MCCKQARYCSPSIMVDLLKLGERIAATELDLFAGAAGTLRIRVNSHEAVGRG